MGRLDVPPAATSGPATAVLAPWSALLALAEATLDALVARAVSACDAGDHEAALRWGQAAAGFVSDGGTFGRLASPELERLSLRVGVALPSPPSLPPDRRAGGRPRRVLHVLTQALPLFGHTKLCRRWIARDPSPAVHDVALIDQLVPLPDALRRAVDARGGRVAMLDARAPLLERAGRLRELAWSSADIVVLHTHPRDLVAAAAFGVVDGPPVLLVNHADHDFWVGGATADAVVDLRPSAQVWTRNHRGIDRSVLLPIPLDEDPALLADSPQRARLRADTRAQLGIGGDAPVFLTVGTPRKYDPVPGLSFTQAADALLARCPRAWLLAVGPTATGEWRAVAERHGGRLLALGPDGDLARFHATADVYLEGMPAGSLTALLEACLAGLACVRAPQASHPPHASDGEALESVAQPVDANAYVEEALELARDGDLRRSRADRLRRSVRAVHVGKGWESRLAAVASAVAPAHAVHPDAVGRPLDPQEVAIRLAYAYPPGVEPRARLCTTLLLQLAQHGDVRDVSRALCAELRQAPAGSVRPGRLSAALLPEVDAALLPHGPDDLVPATMVAPAARWLIRRTVRLEGRWRGAALALRLTPRIPGLWRPSDLLKAARAWAG